MPHSHKRSECDICISSFSLWQHFLLYLGSEQYCTRWSPAQWLFSKWLHLSSYTNVCHYKLWNSVFNHKCVIKNWLYIHTHTTCWLSLASPWIRAVSYQFTIIRPVNCLVLNSFSCHRQTKIQWSQPGNSISSNFDLQTLWSQIPLHQSIMSNEG